MHLWICVPAYVSVMLSNKILSSEWVLSSEFWCPNIDAGLANPSTQEYPGPRLNIKTVFSRYGDSRVKDKTVGETVYW